MSKVLFTSKKIFLRKSFLAFPEKIILKNILGKISLNERNNFCDVKIDKKGLKSKKIFPGKMSFFLFAKNKITKKSKGNVLDKIDFSVSNIIF